MKVKYFVRGVGIGVIVATIILSISFATEGKKLTNDEIIKRAEKLGMVMADNTKPTEPKSEPASEPKSEPATEPTSEPQTSEPTQAPTETPTDAPTQAPTEAPTDAPTQAPPEGTAIISIPSGLNSSYQVCVMLVDAGVITNARDFDKYLEKNGYDIHIKAGNKVVPFGSTYEEIAKILIK